MDKDPLDVDPQFSMYQDPQLIDILRREDGNQVKFNDKLCFIDFDEFGGEYGDETLLEIKSPNGTIVAIYDLKDITQARMDDSSACVWIIKNKKLDFYLGW